MSTKHGQVFNYPSGLMGKRSISLEAEPGEVEEIFIIDIRSYSELIARNGSRLKKAI